MSESEEGEQERRRPHFGYVMYWGALEPVGFATAVPTVTRLARDARVTLFSFEKQVDWEQPDVVQRARERLENAGVRWVPLTYSPGYARTPMDIVKGVRALTKAHRADPLDAVEGRTFVGGLVGALAQRRLGIPLLYHTEGCWLDEQIDQERLLGSSPLLRLLRAIDGWIASRAGGMIALTEGGATRLRDGPLRGRPGVPVSVVPTTSVLVEGAEDVREAPRHPPGTPIRVAYAGSVRGRYMLDGMLTFVEELVARRPGSRLRLLAHRDQSLASAAVARHGLEEAVDLGAVPHDRLPAELSGQDVGLFFLQPGRSEPCVSPTKISEYLAHGLVVVTTRASGDGASVIEGANAGVVLDDPLDPRDRARALNELDRLLLDEARSVRAQARARDFYSLDCAVQIQLEELTRLAGEGRR